MQETAIRRIDWTNLVFIASAHVLALLGAIHLATRFSAWTAALGLVYAVIGGVSITGGYHRLFAHRAYRARLPLRALYLLGGALSVQNSAFKWSVDHRRHHSRTDTDDDPYDIRRGFWWAHIGWVLFKDPLQVGPASAPDLWSERLVRWQHRFYLPLVVLTGALIPFSLGLLWGDPIGAVLVAGFLRLVLQWHATFSVNSFAHMLGTRPYSMASSARDSFVTALISLGEGYHNFHHRFQSDYRNGVRWFHFDPTKWFVWTLSHVGLTSDLKRVPKAAIERAREKVRAELDALRRTPVPVRARSGPDQRANR
jgi:stearoyl-CoA desaturase (delta-9 desaturase)